jgi:plastocyanin
MRLTTALIASFLPAFAIAQYGGPAPSTPTASSAAVAPSAPADTPGQMNINVAFNQTFTFNPSNITAAVGTLVTFYIPNNGLTHSVTQSSFANPCTYLAASGNSSAGFDSGLQAGMQFTINITDNTIPIYFHCKQVTHCGLGMVGSINAPATGNNSFSSFQAAAVAIGPNEQTENDNGPVNAGVGGVVVTGTTSGSTSGSTKIGASAGIALLAAALVASLT